MGAYRLVWQDHPRGCGEHYMLIKNIRSLMGSSPRMRGALIKFQTALYESRIIPADAGSTPISRSRAWLARDHPRGCGEHEEELNADGNLNGIIPADAGSTRLWMLLSSTTADHPRGCGEHPLGAPRQASSPGSSPRMRGAHK